MSETAIKKLEAQEISFVAEMDMVAAVEEKWKQIPDASDKKGDELCRAGAREAQQLRIQITEKGNEIKKRVNDFKTDLDDFVGGLAERLKTKEDALRAEYRRVENEKKRERERQAKLERERIARLRQRIFEITQLGVVPYGSSIDDINKRIDAARETDVSKDEFGEFFAEAHQARESALIALDGIMNAEHERIERERLAAEKHARIEAEQKAERERLEREREEQARIIREHEEKMRAEREVFEQEQREREEALRREREERERDEAAAKAEEAERNRIEREAEEARRAEEQRIEREKREAEEERIAEERRRVDQERAKIEAEKAEQARIKAEKEAKEREEEERKLNAEIQRNNRDEIIMAIMEKFDEEDVEDKGKWVGDIALCIADAIIAGEIPHVKYEG